ncbi:hypothetical protein D9758_005473 [Tetrapyrgos nigripes]|uniref:XPG-I domain-containing protein n=1 Tax=Tetrapyrgos nigripes TaxID=182062 RepID=A0A8H5GHQ4_9AGAR|nr:hypothetical protein D9758_005473 [Tetrapyrgos nigripes]
MCWSQLLSPCLLRITMGIKDLFKLVSFARQETSFFHLSWEFLMHTGRPLIIGVDSSLWFYSIQHALVVQGHHAQLGSNPELANVFYKLCFFRELPIILVLVFDGPSRPCIKRSKRVGATAHWMTQPFKDLALAFGYYVHQAPGEAEAELAYMNRAGVVDAVLTDDSDALLFGAQFRDPDTVATYHTDDIAHKPDRPIIFSGMLLIAILRGGDYSKVSGLMNCGINTAYGLTHYELGTKLMLAADEDEETLCTFLPAWHRKLKNYLANDPHQFVGRKNKKLAAAVPHDFPSMDTVRLYTNPLVSDWSHSNAAPVYNFCLPDLSQLSDLSAQFFLWASPGLLNQKFESKVFGGFGISYLIACSMQPDLIVEHEHNTFHIDDVIDIKVRRSITMLRVQFRSDVLAQLSSFSPTVYPPVIQVWISSSLAGAVSDALNDYHRRLCSLKLTPSIRQKLSLINPLLDNRADSNSVGSSAVSTITATLGLIDLTSDSDSDMSSRNEAVDNWTPNSFLSSLCLVMPKAAMKKGPPSEKRTKKDPKTTKVAQKKQAAPTTPKKSSKSLKDGRTFQEFVEEAQQQQRKHGKSGNTTTSYVSVVKQTRKWAIDFFEKKGDARALFAESMEFVDLLGDSKEDEDEKEAEEEEEEEENQHGTDETKCNDSKWKTMPADFSTCLTGPPTATTPLVISLFMYTKCFEQGKGDLTAWRIYSGWKDHYNQLSLELQLDIQQYTDNSGEGKYRGQWREDREMHEWVGNPMTSARVTDMLAACKNKDGEAEKNQSRAMTMDDMMTIFNWSWRTCPDSAPVTTMEELHTKTEHLLMRAFMSAGFTLWTRDCRNCETSTLKAKDVEWNPDSRPNAPPGDPAAINIQLRERKGWQRKQSKGQTQVNGHLFRIPDQPQTPAIDLKQRLTAWKDHLEMHLLKRPLESEDYLFPSIASNRKSQRVEFTIPVSPETTKKMVNQYAESVGLPGAGKYTTHCFRRGGAQYRFMYAPPGQRWTLAMVKWWGGWSPNERHNTLVRYLLDELHTYEQDHSDALFPIDLVRGKSYLGEAAEQAPLKTSEARTLITGVVSNVVNNLESRVKALIYPLYPYPIEHSGSFPCMPYPGILYPHSAAPSHLHYAQPCPPFHNNLLPNSTTNSQLSQLPEKQNKHAVITTNTSASFNPIRYTPYGPIPIGPSSYAAAPSKPTHPIPDAPFLLQVPKISSSLSPVEAFRQLMKDWEVGDPERNLFCPLKDWKKEWITKSVAVLHGQHRKVAEEFVNVYNRDEALFFDAFPDYKRGIKPLHDAILARQQADGRAKTRISRK